MEITTVGIDLAKSIFQVHAVDAAGQVVVRKALRRAQVVPFFAKLSPPEPQCATCNAGAIHTGAIYIGRSNGPGRGLGLRRFLWKIRRHHFKRHSRCKPSCCPSAAQLVGPPASCSAPALIGAETAQRTKPAQIELALELEIARAAKLASTTPRAFV
jgi:hypothetical protein